MSGTGPMEVVEVLLTPPDNARLANLCGAMDDNISRLSRALAVDIRRRGAKFRLAGPGGATRAAAETLRALYERAQGEIAPRDVQLCIAESMNGQAAPDEDRFPTPKIPPPTPSGPNGPNGPDGPDGGGIGSEFGLDPEALADPDGEAGGRFHRARGGSRRPLRGPKEFAPRTARQREYLEKIRVHDLTICSGPAGAGKTYLAVAAALESIRGGETERLILTRPAVEAGGEKLGFLPGDMEQKVNPYLRPLHESLHRLLGRGEAERRMAKSGRGAIEIIPLAFMRGLTLDGAFVILDEAQNTTPSQMKMLLTRLAPGSKSVVTGDETQDDLPPGAESGLSDAMRRLRGLDGVALHRFGKEDIARHPLTRAVLLAYENGRK